MLSLSSALATAQDATIQNPTIEVTFSKLTAALPLQGQRLDSETAAEVQPGLIKLHNNSLCAAYVVKDTSSVTGILRIAYTDTEQNTFTFADVLTSGVSIFGGDVQTALCETTEVVGSATTHNLLIFTVEDVYGSEQISWFKCSLTGTFISKGTFYTGASNTPPKSVSLLYDGTKYIAAYVRLSTDTTGGAKLYYKTSTNTTTWGAEVNIPLTGLVYANNLQNCNLVMAGTEILLWFDHTETLTNIYNCYYVRSTDGGATWSSPNLVTAYSAPSIVGKHPYTFAATTTSLTVAYDEIKSALHMSSATPNWGGGPMTPASMHFNTSTRILYVVCANTGVGYKQCKGVMGVDVDNWIITSYWDNTTVPAMNSYWFVSTGANIPGGGKIRGEGNYIILSSLEGHICLIDAGSNQIFDYNFIPDAPYSMAANVTGTTDLYYSTGTKLARAMVDATNNKIYCLFVNNYVYDTGVFVGSIDIDHSKTVFSWGSVVSERKVWDESEIINLMTLGAGDFFVDLASDMFAISGACPSTFWGRLRIYSLSGAVLLRDYKQATNAQFPYFGLEQITMVDGVVYGVFAYTATHGQSALKGLCAVDPTANTITNYVPAFLAGNDMKGGSIISTSDGLIIIACLDDGIATFNLAGGWNLYNDASLPGLSPGGTEYYDGPLAYDAVNQLIFCSFDSSSNGNPGIAAFSIAGSLSSPQYMIGTETSGTWSFTAPAQLVAGIFSQKAAIAQSLGGYIAAFWLNLFNFIYWDIESGNLDATPYLMRGSDVQITMQMDGSPGKLSLTLANGYLFEQFNQSSLLAPYAQKGKIIQVRFGEMIGGVATWQPGSFQFVITTQKMGYRRGDKPTITIEAEDRRVLFDQQGTITATPYFESVNPDEAITTLLTSYGNWLAGEVNMPTFDGETFLEQQWLDKNLIDVCNEIAHRFQYFLKIDTTTGQITAQKIDFSAATNHIYATLSFLDQFTPDDNYSDFTNKITVIGESPSQITVNYPEERVTGESGTLGWWKKKGERTNWYSDDKTKTCVNPRLEMVETASNIAYLLAGQVTEKLTTIDPNNQYVVVEITAPDLTFVLIGAFALMVYSRKAPPIITPSGPAKSWMASLAGEMGMWIAFQVLASVGPYQYDIYAQPTGLIRQSLQASAYDYTFQSLLNGTTIEKRIDEPLCHSVAECQTMADFEMQLTIAQRNRMKMIKAAHLQDEAGDIIEFPHPYSNMMLRFYVATITRKMHVPDNTDTAGIFTDEIEGWKI